MVRVLVVDDERNQRDSLGELLRDADCHVHVAEHADQAMRILAEYDFDVVVTDMILPKTTGMDLLKAIKKVTPDMQVILMTGCPNNKNAFEAVGEGACDYLAKPIGKSQLLKAVANAKICKTLNDRRRR